MSSRLLLVYLALLHLILLAGGFIWLRDTPGLLIGFEVLLMTSVLIGFSIWSRLRAQQRLINDGTAALKDQDYSVRLREVGVSDVDQLINVYNKLLAKIRDERLDNQRRQFFLSLLIESSSLGLITMDYDGNLEAINAHGRKQLGLKSFIGEGQSRQHDLPKLLSDIDHPLAELLSQLKEEERTLIRLQNGNRFRVESAAFIARGFSRRFITVSNISEDLAEAEVAAYGKVIRMMAHEVNNSTAATRSMLQTLIDTDDLDDQAFRVLATKFLPRVYDRGEDMNEFMRRFAAVIRLPSAVLEEVSLDKILRNQAQLFNPICEQAGIKITLQLEPTLIKGDAALLNQVIINALTNAKESIGDRKGEIQLSSAQKGFLIRDNGAGIDPAIADMIFTPFYSSKPTGQGIGLTLSRDILDRHKANYSLETAEDGWTSFQVVFPE